MHTLIRLILMATLLTIAGANLAAAGDEVKHGVYEFVINPSDLDFETACSALQAELMQSPFVHLAAIDATGKDECGFRSRVFACSDTSYAQQLLAQNSHTGSFAAVDRINVFEDENGVHVSIVNPFSVNRTVLMDDTVCSDLTARHSQALRKLVTDAVSGTATERQYGEFRKKGYIGRTMGVMAGGDFDGKVEEILVLTNVDLATAVERLETAMADSVGKWGMRSIYTLQLPSQQAAIIGSTSPTMAAKSYSIVNAGSDKSRKKLACPGLGHAGAYPIDVLVAAQPDGSVKVLLIDVMYRMKMYFEDAGKWAFMKNMGMPGSIEDELKTQIANAFPELES